MKPQRPQNPTVDDVCEWLATSPPLDDVAEELRHMRLGERDLASSIQLLRQHVLLAIGEGSSSASLFGEDEPF